MKINRTIILEILLAAGLIAVAVGWRVINHGTMLMPNLELVTAVSLMAAVWLRKPWGLSVPLVTMLVSDGLIGNSAVAWFTWSAFLIIGLSGLVLRRWKGDDKKLLLGSAGMGLGAAMFFFLWTNLGVWLLGDGSFYPHTLAGLLLCYEMGLPFIRATLISGAVVTPVVFAMGIYAPRLVRAVNRSEAVVGSR